MKNILNYVFLLAVMNCLITSIYANPDIKQYAFRSLDINNGLSQNTVHAIIQDRQGFMWFATKDGLNRYDGTSFYEYMKELGTLGNNFITTLFEDNQGQIWIGTDMGLYIYSPLSEKVERFYQKSNLGTVIDHTIRTITGDKDGGVWITSQEQGIFYYNSTNKKLNHYKQDTTGGRDLNINQICFDTDNVCWFDLYDGNLYYTKDKFKTITPVFPQDGKEPFRQNYICKIAPGPYNCIYVGSIKGLTEVNLTNKKIRNILTFDEKGDNIYVRDITFYTDSEFWVGTETGLYIHDLQTEKTTHLQNINGDPYSISDNAIYSIYKDREGGMWIGSYFGGVNYYPKQYTYFDKFYVRSESDEMGKRVREFAADKNGTLWVGTEDKGLFKYNTDTRTITPFKNSQIYHNIHGLCVDENYLWVGTFSKGLNRIDIKTSAVKHYEGIGNDIFSICRTTSGKLWIGTTIGLYRYDPQLDKFEYISELSGVFIYSIKEDKQGNLWLATYVNGIYKRNVRTEKWEHFVYNDRDPDSLPNNKVLSIFEDSKNQLWFTTQGGGFCKFVPSTKKFIRYDSNIGLPSNVIYKIEEDKKGLFWITTNKGLLRFNPENMEMKIYTIANGLLSNQFNYQSSYKEKSGRIYFGSINGFISFDPSSFIDNDYLAPIVITDFMLFNKPVPVGAKDSPLKKSITLSNNIELKSNQNSFSFKVAALSYQSPTMNTLVYKLEGFDTEWYVASNSPITYSNLPYGSYTFMVKGANSDGVWNPDIRTLQIRVLPPFYLSIWAYCIYTLLIIFFSVAIVLYYRRRSANKHQRIIEKFEQEKERELYISKIDFFTNVAHEIRTPLTLIKSPLESVLSKEELSEDIKLELETMDQNAERLLNLTNQLLDFRKTENKGFKLNPIGVNLTNLIQSVYSRFTALAKQRKLDFRFETVDEKLSASVDKESIIKIVSNLLTNGIKYADTYVHLQLSVDNEKEAFLIVMINDGSVVPIEMREQIFRPFVQYRDGKKIVPGTGIGLALARSLAELHQGILEMDHSVDYNRFVLSIPIIHQSVLDPLTEEAEEFIENSTSYREVSSSILETKKEGESVLVIEDNKNMLEFISRQLTPLYKVFKAENGIEALKILDMEYINLIISDVMMPEMDGLELCQRLKSDLNHSHIPIILLTAKTALESKIEGLEYGADTYIEKPFSVEYLRANVANLLNNRERLRRRFIESPFVNANTMAITKADELFLEKLNEYVSNHMDDSNLVIDDLADIMNMGRSNFYRKLKGILDMSPNEYLRLERLKKAAALLKAGEYGIVDISYMVGFSSPSYFSVCFKKQFGVLPKDFAD